MFWPRGCRCYSPGLQGAAERAAATFDEQKELKREQQQPQRKHGDARECGSCLSPGRTHCFLPVSRTQTGCQPASEDLLHLHIHGQQWVNVVVKERLAFEPAPSEVSVSTGVTWQLTGLLVWLDSPSWPTFSAVVRAVSGHKIRIHLYLKQKQKNKESCADTPDWCFHTEP